jgi:hypothetical protein
MPLNFGIVAESQVFIINIGYFIVGGGGAAANSPDSTVFPCGGGGGGGAVTGLIGVVPSEYQIISFDIGAGGTGGNVNVPATNGGNTIISLDSSVVATAVGGGRGTCYQYVSTNGGCGGGSSASVFNDRVVAPTSGIPGQGYGGGISAYAGNLYGTLYASGGGGGSGAVGGNGTYDLTASPYSANGGNGGNGIICNFDGNYYAGGGGGSAGWYYLYQGSQGIGGLGGGGDGSTGFTRNNGVNGFGGGGGGANTGDNQVTSASGGSGAVLLSMPTVIYSGIYTGSPTVTVNGLNTVLKFTGASGSYTSYFNI